MGIYLYGSTRETSERWYENLRRRFPKLRIAGREPSLFRTLLPEEGRALAERIRSSGAGVVFIGLGAQHRSCLPTTTARSSMPCRSAWVQRSIFTPA